MQQKSQWAEAEAGVRRGGGDRGRLAGRALVSGLVPNREAAGGLASSDQRGNGPSRPATLVTLSLLSKALILDTEGNSQLTLPWWGEAGAPATTSTTRPTCDAER